MTKEVNISDGVGQWRSIRALWHELKNNSSIKLCDGNRTAFWKDNWLGNGSPQENFPDIFGLVHHQQDYCRS